MLRKRQPIVVYAAGTWDMFHIGHVRLLRAMRGMGDIVVVGVGTDDYVEANKGKRPVVPFKERMEVLRSCKYVDVVIAETSLDKKDVIDKFDIDILVVGDDFWERKVGGDAYMRSRGGRVVYMPYTQETSSTKIRQKLKKKKKQT